jgi:hypothetical protein
MPSLYSNENLSIDLVERIREFGYDMLTSYQAGQANQGIPDLLCLRRFPDDLDCGLLFLACSLSPPFLRLV